MAFRLLKKLFTEIMLNYGLKAGYTPGRNMSRYYSRKVTRGLGTRYNKEVLHKVLPYQVFMGLHL